MAFAAIAAVLAAVLLHYGLWNIQNWRAPSHYDSDSLHLLALFEAVSRGECWPYTSFLVSGLGAPFVANWNDYPITCPVLLLVGGFITKWLGVAVAANFLLVMAHVSSALAMFISLRLAGAHRVWAGVFSVCFGLTPLLFYRGLTHLVLTFAYSVPITLALCYLIFQRGSSFLRGWRLLLVCAIAFYFGGIFPYYTAFFLMAMAFAALYCLLNEKKFSVLLPFALIALSTLAHFYTVTEPFRQYSRENGENFFAVSRFYSNVQLNALRPVEMLLPGSSSRLPVLKQISAFYENQDIFRDKFEYTESMVSYLGLPAITGLFLLFGMTGYFVFTRQQQKIPGWFWFVGFFIAFAVVGGVNGILGLAKFFLLRSSNRVSIYIAAACFFFLALLLTRLSRRIPRAVQGPMAFSFVAAAVFEALPLSFAPDARAAHLYNSDRQMASVLESRLPGQAMVFNYPVIDFPEAGTYAHLRPYLFADSLRFSFGSVKGRARETWQHDVLEQPAEAMAAQLEDYGFSGILVYRGEDLSAEQKKEVERFVEETAVTQAESLVSEGGDFVFVVLNPASSPALPKMRPQFLSTWWQDTIQPASLSVFASEGLRWSAQPHGEIEIFNERSQPQDFLLKGSMMSMNDASLSVFLGEKKLQEIALRAGELQPVVIDLPSLKSGASRIRFESDAQPELVDGRKFNFALALQE